MIYMYYMNSGRCLWLQALPVPESFRLRLLTTRSLCPQGETLHFEVTTGRHGGIARPTGPMRVFVQY